MLQEKYPTVKAFGRVRQQWGTNGMNKISSHLQTV